MIFRCFKCDTRIVTDNTIGEQVIECVCGQQHIAKHFKNGKTTVKIANSKKMKKENR